MREPFLKFERGHPQRERQIHLGDIKLEYLAVYGRASMGVPVGELQSTGLEARIESRSANHRPSRLGHVGDHDGL